MTKKDCFCVFLLINLAVFPLAANDVFEFRHIPGARYRILSIVDETVIINGTMSYRAEILNRIAAEVINVTDGKGQHRAVFQTSHRIAYDFFDNTQDTISGYQWSREYETVFDRDRLGNLTIPPQYFMPVVRNVPVFPDRPLNVGDRWHAQAHEMHDFRDGFGIVEPYRIPFNAFYEYVGDREWKGNFYPAFSINYNIESRPAAVRGRIYPVRISATVSQLVYWDHSIGKEAASEGTFRFVFILSDGNTIEFRGTAVAELIEADYMNREQIISEIVEELNRLEMPDVVVREVQEGITLSLENIQFLADSDRMLPGEQEKLDRIVEILMRYPDRDIIVSGHAALAGSADYLMSLSQARARTIANYLLSRNVRSADRIVTRGFGAERPIADNNTDEGMRRNRRVEITILEN